MPVPTSESSDRKSARLALHVRAHERAVRIVMFQKRNQEAGDRHDLLGAHVHEVDLVRSGQV